MGPGSVRLAFIWGAGFVVTVAAAAFLLGRIGTDQPPAVFVPRPLTSFLGGEYHPAILVSGWRLDLLLLLAIGKTRSLEDACWRR